MKKFLAKILSGALAAVMALFVLNGCALITTNTERDMAQVIATVAVDDSLSEDIYKRELVSAYASQGYYYVDYQGMAAEDVYEMLLEDIVKNRILKQQAKIAFTGKSSINDVGYFAQAAAETDKTSYDQVLAKNNWKGNSMTSLTKTSPIELFMTEYEYYTIQYNVLSSIKTFIEGYEEQEDEEEHNHNYETFQGEVRTAPTQETEKTGNEYEMEKDDEISKIDVEGDFYKTFEKINEDASLNLDLSTYPNKYELSLNVYKEYVKNFDNSIKGNKVEINKIVRDLKSVGFISSSEASSLENYDKDELLNLTYFADALEIQYENKLIEKYELALQNEQEKLLAGEGALYNAYVNLFKTQQNKFDGSYTDYETALSNASDSNLVLYNPDTGAGKYGYVLNLLIGFSDEQSAILTALDEKVTLKKEDRDNARKALLNGLVAKDQRSSWIESNYGVYDETANSFTFKDSYCGTSLLNTFYGSLYGAKKYVYHDSYDEEVDGYSFESIKAREIPFNEFYETIVLGAMGVSNTDRSGVIKDLSDEQIDTFKDLIYAFSTDPGSLSSANGYVYSPKTSATTYVKEFSAAAKELVNDVNKGKGAYTVVATDYGYHILLCVEVIEPTTAMIERATFETDMLVEGTIPYLFREYQKARLVVDNVDKITSKFFNDNLESSVTYYEDTYEDLF